MICRDETVVIYLDGIPFPQNHRKDSGCKGVTHQYTTSTSITDATYEWSLDGIPPKHPLLGTDSSFSYTFDDQKHQLFLVVRSAEKHCSIQINLEVSGKNCAPCPIKCKSESVNIPEGALNYLVDEIGSKYLIEGDNRLSCGETNGNIIQSIMNTIHSNAKCAIENLEVKCLNNLSNPNCLTLTIKNSPIKFRYISVGNSMFTFNTLYC